MPRIATFLAGLAGAVLCAATPAHAESRAWTAAKKTMPAGLDIVFGVNATPVRTSKLFTEMWPKLIAMSQSAGKAVDMLKSTCSIDAQQVVDSAAFGGTSDHVVMVVAFKGLVQKDIEACLDKLSQANDHKPMTVEKAGAFVKYGAGTDHAYARWLGKDTVAFTDAPEDKDLLAKMTAGGITGDKVMKAALAAVKTDAAAWAVANKSQDLEEVHAKMSQIYGSADLKGGNIGIDVRITVDSAKSATSAAATANERLAGFKTSNQLPPAFMALAKALVIKSAGSDLVITASLTEGDLVAMATSALSMLGH